MAPNASLPMLEPNCSASIETGDRLALELLLGFTGMRSLRAARHQLRLILLRLRSVVRVWQPIRL